MNKFNQLCVVAILPVSLMGTAEASFVFDGNIESDGWGTTRDRVFFDVSQAGTVDFNMNALSGNLSPTMYLYEQGVPGYITYAWDGWEANMSWNLGSGSYLLMTGDSSLYGNDFYAADYGYGWGGYQLTVNGAALATSFEEGNLNGSFTASTPSAVPVPAAAWLFASGLVGLVGFARRKVS